MWKSPNGGTLEICINVLIYTTANIIYLLYRLIPLSFDKRKIFIQYIVIMFLLFFEVAQC